MHPKQPLAIGAMAPRWQKRPIEGICSWIARFVQKLKEYARYSEWLPEEYISLYRAAHREM